ncbi:unnamed protein product [Clonostachys rosea]|uniref:O-methyltransferase C-terminal domain-containing protein n=1 Tax=Bionectria ochroleuca TaxID=29856 RepID=A0ABY6U5X4_BIOOC|nr:unnamed protein product [Clonostachys rosea]
MSLLQNLIKSLTSNVQELESVMSTSGDGSLPHLYESKPYAPFDDENCNPPWPAFMLTEKIRADVRALEAAVTPTRQILLANTLVASKPAALSAAATLGVTDAIIQLGGRASVEQLAKSLQVNEAKLSIYDNLVDPETRDSWKAEDAPFCKTVSKSGETFSQYIMEPQHAQELDWMQKGVRTTRASLLEDYPWASLGKTRVVDVGCGPGDSAFDILQEAPELQWTFQDLAPVLEGLKATIPEKLVSKVSSGEISFQVQDYFQPNVSRGDVWFLRGIIREYDDADAIKVLQHIAEAMRKTKGSRMLINEVLCSSASIINEGDSTSVPSQHMPHHQSAFPETSNLMTWNTYCLFGGKERSFEEVNCILGAAGLVMANFYNFRTITVMIECTVVH